MAYFLLALKMDSWNTRISLWDGLFLGAILVAGRVPTPHCFQCRLRICRRCIGILLGGNGRMKMVMHLGTRQKERKHVLFVSFIMRGKMWKNIYFFLGGGQEYGKIFDLSFGRERERIFTQPCGLKRNCSNLILLYKKQTILKCLERLAC